MQLFAPIMSCSEAEGGIMFSKPLSGPIMLYSMNVSRFKVLTILEYFYDSLFDVLSYPLLFQSGTCSRRTLSTLYPVPRAEDINLMVLGGTRFSAIQTSQKYTIY